MKVLRTKQISELLNVNPQTLRIWVESLPPYNSRKKSPRKAHSYNAQEALFFLVIRSIVRDLGIKISSLTGVSENLLYMCSERPFGELRNYHLRISLDDKSVKLSHDLNVSLYGAKSPIILVPLEPFIDEIRKYLLGDEIESLNYELPFPYQKVSGND